MAVPSTQGQSPNANGPQSPSMATNWFGSMFGHCCKGPPIEGELRFEDLAEDKKQKKKAKKAAKSPAKDVPDAKDVSDAPQGGTRRYKVDNSVLQIENRPGVAYRYSKREADKVKNGHGPARWDEIVEGVDEGDGWLKVGQYYLPMKYQGIAVVTPMVDPGNGLELDSIKSKQVPVPSQQESKKQSSAGDTNSKARDTCATSTTSPPRQTIPKQDVPKQEVVTSVPSPVVDKKPEPKQETPQRIETAVVSPLKVPEESKKPPAPEWSASFHTERAVEEKGNFASFAAPEKLADEKDLAKTPEVTGVSESETALSAFNANAWQFRPSVGTWLQTVPKAQEAARLAEIKEVDWYLLPSVGTWLQRRRFTAVGADSAPTDIADQEAKAALKLKEIEACGADIVGMCAQKELP